MAQLEKATLKDVLRKDDEVSKIFGNIIHELPEDIQKSPHFARCKFVADMALRIEEIKKGIFLTVQDKNYYSTNILVRVLIEHFYMFNYIVQRLVVENNDDVIDQYNSDKFHEEQLSYFEALQSEMKIIKKHEWIEKALTGFLENHPHLKGLKLDKLREKNQHFKMKSIIAYLLSEIDFSSTSRDTPIPELMNLEFIHLYSKLSSFIHCGPSAKMMEDGVRDENKLESSLLNKIDSAMEMSAGARIMVLFIYTVSAKNKQYYKIAAEAKKYITFPS